MTVRWLYCTGMKTKTKQKPHFITKEGKWACEGLSQRLHGNREKQRIFVHMNEFDCRQNFTPQLSEEEKFFFAFSQQQSAKKKRTHNSHINWVELGEWHEHFTIKALSINFSLVVTKLDCGCCACVVCRVQYFALVPMNVTLAYLFHQINK